MKKALLTTALTVALGTSAIAQGIEPVATTPELDVTVGTFVGEQTTILAVIAAAAIIAGIVITSDESSDGT